jgi:ferredoxin/flavodoxin---NADP+ reductase
MHGTHDAARTERRLRIAIVGAGPSGMYATEALMDRLGPAARIDLFDRVATPFGLVRYGVAPDHLTIRSVRTTLERVLAGEGVRFFGNVRVGHDLPVAELQRCYHALIFTYGASKSRMLGIAGEDLMGSVAATDLVAWYCGHPQAVRERIEASLEGARSAVVVGVGNVAVDVVRILAKSPAELSHTDMPQHVLDTLAASQITDIHLLGRRGPAQAAFTTKELRELGELLRAEVLVDPNDLVLDPVSASAVASSRTATRNLQVLEQWARRTPMHKGRRIHLHFLTRPVELRGRSRVEEVVVERTRIDKRDEGGGTGGLDVIAADLVVRSIGYRGEPVAGVPFDPQSGIIPNRGGRVTRGRDRVPGLYVAGWIKRGPSGIIGTNKKDAAETVDALCADLDSLPGPSVADPDHVVSLLRERGVEYVTLDGWRAIDAAEIILGQSRGRERTTVHEPTTLLEIARGEAAR